MNALKILKKRLVSRNIDAILISQPDNRRYLSGYSAVDHDITESSGFLFIPKKGQPLLLTDSRFQLEAKEQAPAYEILLYNKGLLALLASLLQKYNIKRLGFEPQYTLYSTGQKLEKVCTKEQIELIGLAGLVEKIRIKKTAEELIKLKQSVLLNEKVLQTIIRPLKPGITEIEIAIQLENMMRMEGAERPSFATIVASGPNSAYPHATPSSRVIQKGEPVLIDMGLVLDGYCSDMTRTIALGPPSEKFKTISRIVRQAQLAGMAMIKAGRTGRQIDQAARQIIKKQGYDKFFGHGLGHGVGLQVHEAPALSPRYNKKLQSGMVVTVEPGIYLPNWGGVRLENMVVVEDYGCQVLNQDDSFLDI